MMSACIASILRAVSSSVSPFTTLLDEGEKLITSALNRFAANSNDVRVLVLGSKNRLTTVLPRNAGTFLISRPVTSLKESAVSSTSVISSTDKGARLSKSLRLRLMASSASRLGNDHSVILPMLFQQDLDFFLARCWQILSDVRGLDRQLAMAAINQHRQLDLFRSSEIHQAVHRRTDRASC